MKKSFLLMAFFLVSCAADPQTGMSITQKIGYVMQCTGNGVCPPMPNQGYQAQAEYQRVAQQRGASERPIQTNCVKTGNITNCTSY